LEYEIEAMAVAEWVASYDLAQQGFMRYETPILSQLTQVIPLQKLPFNFTLKFAINAVQVS